MRPLQKTVTRLGISLAAILALAGCGTSMLAGRTTNPVIQDFNVRWWSDASSLSTTASRRLALMVYKKDGQHEALVTCAEPPPDVGETFAKALAAQLEVSLPKSAGELKGGYADHVATAIAPLMVRTQGLQILRDSAYTLCVDYMNGWIKDSDTYIRIKQDRFDKALSLIREELPHLPARVAPVPALGPPAQPPQSVQPARVAASGAIPAQAAASAPGATVP